MSRKYTPKERIAVFWSKVDCTAGLFECWIWTAGKDEWGYGEMGWGERGVCRTHRISYELAYGPIPNELKVLHKCDNPPCCNPSHLFLGTDADNMRDRDQKGRLGPRDGENNGRHKLTWDQVRSIRQRYAEGGITIDALASEYGAGHTTISHILLNQTWRESEP